MTVTRSKSRAPRALAVAVVGLMTLSTAATGLAQTPQFRTQVEIVQLQVAVAGSDGRHVRNLEADDIVLRVDGDLRDVVALYEVDLSDIGAEEDDTYVPPAGWRQFLLFFDFTFSTKAGILRAREAAANFVTEQTHPRDLVAVASYSTVGGLKLISPFTADREQVLDALSSFGLGQSQHIIDPAGFSVSSIRTAFEIEASQADTNDADTDGLPDDVNAMQQTVLDELFSMTFLGEANDFRRYREQVVNYAHQLGGLGALLQATSGRKHVMLFSAGFDDEVLTGQTLDELAEDSQRINTQGALGMASVNSETRFGSVDLRNTLQDAIENFRHADVVFHAFDVGGLGNVRRDDTFATTQSGKQALSYIADSTNGTVHWNQNDLAPALGQVALQTSQYYVVAYRKLPTDPPVVDLQIEIQRPGAQVVAAPTRFAPPPSYAEMDEAQRQLQLAEFIAKGIEEEDMTFDIRAVPFVGKGRVSRVAVVMEVPFAQLRRIADARADGRAELDVLGYVLDERGEMRDLFSRKVSLDVDRISERMEGLPFRYYDLLWSLPGQHRVRVLVRDGEVGMLSTRTVEVDVPTFEAPQAVLVSGPVAVDASHPGLLMRGFDAASPPAHRQGGPVGYPFMLGEQEITPQVYTVVEPGGTCHFMMVSYNVTRHPFTGQTQTNLDARFIGETGSELALEELSLVGRHYDPETNATTMVVAARLPADIAPGAYLLEIDLIDVIGGQTVQQVLPVVVEATVAQRD